MKKRISFDIDGVIVDYPKIWLDYLEIQTGVRFISSDEAREALGSTYVLIKNQYRVSDYKYSRPIKPEAKFLSELIKSLGILSVVHTSRLQREFHASEERISTWLTGEGFYHAGVYPKTKQMFQENGPILHLDDDAELCLKMSEWGLSTKFIYFNGSLTQVIAKQIKGIAEINHLENYDHSDV
jgi:hypothetical protein